MRPAGEGESSRALVAALIFAGLFLFFWRQSAGVADALRLALPDNDDAVRLAGVRDLLAGQSWWDEVQHRYGPPAGTLMHWSRLVDAPIAAIIMALSLVFGSQWGERLAVAGWPFFLFLVYAAVIGRGAWTLISPRAAGFAIFAAGQMVVFSDLFAAGRIDHHNLQIVLMSAAAIGFGLAGRGRGGALLSGVTCGLSLAIGLETLPFAAVIAAAFALAWTVEGEAAGPALQRFGAGLAATAILAFAVQTAPWLWLTPACDALSGPWLLLTSGGGLALGGLGRATPNLTSRSARFAAAACCAAICVAAFALVFPACLHGPYQAVPEPYRSLWIGDILEAFPFRRFLHANPDAALQSVMPMLIAAAAASFGAKRAGRDRAFVALLAALLWLGVALAVIQIRTVYIASAFLPLAIGWFFDRLLAPRGRRSAPRTAVAACCGLLMLGLPWAAGAPLLRALTSGSIRGGGAAANSASPPCNDPRSVGVLATLPPGLVLAEAPLGASILLHTPHSIVVAGYHRAPAGIVAGIEAFSGDEADMRRVATKRQVDYLVICPADPFPRGSFAAALAKGASAAWLTPLGLPGGPLKAWRVTGLR